MEQIFGETTHMLVLFLKKTNASEDGFISNMLPDLGENFLGKGGPMRIHQAVTYRCDA